MYYDVHKTQFINSLSYIQGNSTTWTPPSAYARYIPGAFLFVIITTVIYCYAIASGYTAWKKEKTISSAHTTCNVDADVKLRWPYNDPWVVNSSKKFIQNTQLTFLSPGVLAMLIFIPNVHSVLWAFVGTILSYFYYKVIC